MNRGIRPHLSRRAFSVEDSFLKGIVPWNIWRCPHGTTGIRLGVRWAAMLEDLAEVGPVLSVTPSPLAVLGEMGPHPAAIGGAGFDFAGQRWHSARATRRNGEGGNPAYAVEFFDLGRNVVHKICLNASSDFEAFSEWLREHQDAGDLPAYGPDRGGILPLAPAGREIGHSILHPLLRRWMSGGIPLRATVFNGGARHATSLVIRIIQESGGWHFIRNEWSGLHLNLRDAGGCLFDESLAPSITLVCKEGVPAASFAPLEPHASAEWRKSIHDLI